MQQIFGGWPLMCVEISKSFKRLSTSDM